MNSVPHQSARPSVGRFIATFGYAWFTIGLFTGTLVLVVAVRGILDTIQKLGWGQNAQNRILIGVILLFVVISFMLARRLVLVLYRHPPRTRRIALVALALPAAAAMYAWSNPARFLSRFAGSASSSLQLAGGPAFIFGAYPDEEQLRTLKQQGVTNIVSLQDPRVLVELQGIKDERSATEKLGLNFIQAPMLPWVSDNTESLEQIRQIALHGKGTYYVHCGLGRDRTNIAKRIIESVGPQSNARVAGAASLKSAVTFDKRANEPFERGRLFKLAEGTWVIPFPNEQEFYGYIIQGQPGQVILALDPTDSTQAEWIAGAERDMKQYVVKYSLLPTTAGDTGVRRIKAADTSAANLARLVAEIRAQRTPVTVVIPHTAFEERPRAPLLRALLQAYGSSALQPAVATKASDAPKTEGSRASQSAR
jgi:hypothetical protein